MIRVEVVRAWPRRHEARRLELPAGATVATALENCGLALDGISGYAIFGERVGTGAPLRDGDRLELLAPLRIDPKEARRRRAGQG
ncbi:MAG TPA: RnfH family protein [Luteimonas sp.]|nr:RnfH family protein [Luteimonas sp.]